MELRHIRYFLAVANERNFTRAAAKLGIGQPPLSMQIKDLETEIGYALFDRTAQGVELTEAGQAFLQAVQPLPALAEGATASARRAAQGETGTLRLGFTGTAGMNPLIPGCIRAFRQAYPDVFLNVMEANSIVLLQALANQQLDIALLRQENAVPEGVRVQLLLQEPLVAALPADHPLARIRGKMTLPSLRDEHFILTPKESGTSLRESVLQACRQQGFTPMEGQPAPHIVSILSVVAAGLGVSLVPESMRQFSLAGVVFKQIKAPVPTTGLAVAWNDQALAATAQNFLTLVKASGIIV
ncbi:LysR family transcriptional regulator [Pantoea sp. Acro-805]|uniref:LysR family transcriptional regulator n=1 Tax=Candidatus Pantoea formicae TaxID=2608355 RepID=A0ABX0QT95_9GAMM|nr:LysR family transcriptional regulator [Pantoea formicae]NIF00274.1 LysR family transcriptional regulator [Pantoea formicae]